MTEGRILIPQIQAYFRKMKRWVRLDWIMMGQIRKHPGASHKGRANAVRNPLTLSGVQHDLFQAIADQSPAYRAERVSAACEPFSLRSKHQKSWEMTETSW